MERHVVIDTQQIQGEGIQGPTSVWTVVTLFIVTQGGGHGSLKSMAAACPPPMRDSAMLGYINKDRD